MKVVLDTNIIISALNFSGNERRILDLARSRHYELYLSCFILQEVAGVLRRKFFWDESQIELAIALLTTAANIVEPRQQPPVIEHHQADNHILECAVEVAADYLVTGDRRHLLPLQSHSGTKIVNSARFLSVL